MRAARLLALLIIVGLAAYLRFSGLAWGHRHPMHTDEQLFVDNVVAMLDAGDLDHRFYRYPGLFMYLLAAGIAPLGPEGWHTNDAYIAARGVVATFGVLHVAVLCFVVSRLVGERAGLVAALMAAVSPVDVVTSHQVRPDVVMQVICLLAILALRRVGPDTRGDVLTGLAIGLASAVKYTGLLLVPSYVLARLFAPGPRLRGLLIAGGLTVAVVIVCTPYALLHARQYREGPAFHLHQYYPGEVARAMVAEHARYFLRVGVRALGPLGAVSFVVGAAVLLSRSWRAWAPSLLYPLTTVAVMSTGSLVFPRYLLPCMGVLYLAAAVPFELLSRTAAGRVLAAALAAATVLPSLRESRDYVYLASRESANDKALDWILAHVDRGARILETRPAADPGGTPGAMIGLPKGRYELVFRNQEGIDDLMPLIAPRMDLVIMDPGMGWSALKTVFAGENAVGVREVMLKVPARRPEEPEVDLGDARLSASDNPGGLPAMIDGDPKTSWVTSGPLRGDEWIEVAFAEPLRLARIELLTQRVPERHDPELAVMADDGTGYQPVASVSARPPLREQAAAGRPLSQELMLKPRLVRGVRILQLGRRSDPWDVAEIRIAARRRPEASP
ncbi:MAG TPA: glycosyltransferase family 39 protein [Vicinamibacteria bacterium]